MLAGAPVERERRDAFAIVLAERRRGAALRILAAGDNVVAVISRAGVNEQLVRAWARRFGVAVLDGVPADARSAGAIHPLPTVVLAADRRVAGLASAYADAVGARCVPISDAAALRAALVAESSASSATVVTLGESFDHAIVDALADGNAERTRRGRPPLTSGVLAAFDPPKLAWLLVKTLVYFGMHIPADATIARFDGIRGTVETRSLGDGAEAIEEAEPWTDTRTVIQSVVAHGAAFDLDLGRTVLCSQIDPPLKRSPTAVAPSCFHDGVCFRLGRENGPIVRRPADRATPLLWGIDSCGTIPFRENAFGPGTSYALALLAGSAVAIVGSYLALTTSGLASRAFEALIEAGWSTGEIAAALGDVEPAAAAFNPYVCLGSPDLRIAAPAAAPRADVDQSIVHVRLTGRDTVAVPLAPHPPGLRDVVDDDGSPAWRGARALRVHAPGRAALVVAFDGPQQLDGTLRLAEAAEARTALAQRCEELERRLAVLGSYEFVAADAHASAISELRATLAHATASARAEPAVRSLPAAAGGLLQAGEQLSALQRSVAESFVRTVLERDVCFDRESQDGFRAGALRRAVEPCHICGGPLYVALDRWRHDERQARTKATCPNCFGVALRPERSPLDSVGIDSIVRGATLHLGVSCQSAVDRPLSALAAAAPRRGRGGGGEGVVGLEIAAHGEMRADFEFTASAGAVVTYRVLVLCEAAVELYTAIDPVCSSSGTTSASRVTLVGALSARPGHGRADGLNQIG